MGFYGNITNVNSTQFSFDKIYPNRYEMERLSSFDGIYLGRFVLVEYDNNLTQNEILYKRCYSKTVNGVEQFFSAADCSASTRLKASEVEKGEVIYVEKNGKNIYYICTGSEGSYASFKPVTQGESVYATNYDIDINKYGASRGFDSTVWQKVYVGTTEKYVMVAELNSVVPTFDLTIDAPTMNPIVPHFDVDSTNVYYKLHLQPTWGFRVAAADGTNSDQTVTWKTSSYNKETDETTTTTVTKSGAINFNKPAFEPQLNQASIKKKDNTENYITVLPTGKSNNEYNVHDGHGSTSTAEDIQEMRINLPAIGNMMSDAWDIIHGPNRDNSSVDSLQGRLNFFTQEIKSNEIPVQSKDGYLVGAAITDDEWISTKVNGKNITIKHTFNKQNDTNNSSNINGNGDTIALYTPIVDSSGHIVGKNTETVTLPYGYKHITSGAKSSAVKEITSNTTKISADNTQDVLTIAPGNKWIRTAGNDSNDTLTVAHEVHSITTTKKDNSDLDGTGSFTVQDLLFDEAGHVTANQAHTYNLPYAVRNIKVNSTNAVTAGSNTAGTIEADKYNDEFILTSQNRWVTLKADTTNDTISIGHAAAGGTTITTAGDTSAATPNFGETFTTPYVKYDEMGHITEKGTRNITIPKGSLTDTASSNTENVLTGIGFTPSSGAITATHQTVGTLKLTGLTAVKANDGTYVQATDTINSGIHKIEIRLDAEIASAREEEGKLNKRIDDLDYTDTENTSQVVYKVDQSNGIISPSRKNVGELLMSGYTKPTSVSNGSILAGENLNTALGKLEYRLEGETSRATTEEGKIRQEFVAADNNLKTEITGITSQISKDVSDENTRATTEEEKIRQEFVAADASLKTEITGITNQISKDVSDENARATKAESDLGARIDAILDGITEEELNTFKELSDALNDDADFAGSVTKAIAQETADRTTAIAEEAAARTKAISEEADARQTAIAQEAANRTTAIAEETAARQTAISAETSSRESAISAINSRLDNAPGFAITTEDISKWNNAEQNVQSDWAQTDEDADDFIKNKPTDLVKTSDITDMVVKSDLDQLATKNDISNMLETTTKFDYTEIVPDVDGNPIKTISSFTVEDLMNKVSELEEKISQLEQLLSSLEQN